MMYRAYPAPPQSASTGKDSAAAAAAAAAAAGSGSGITTRTSTVAHSNAKTQPWPATGATTTTATTAKASNGIRPMEASPRPPHIFNSASTRPAMASATPGNVRLMSPSRAGRTLPPGVSAPAAVTSSAAAANVAVPLVPSRPLGAPLGLPPLTSRPFSFDKSATIMEDKIEARKKKLEALKAKSLHSSTILARAKAVTAPPTVAAAATTTATVSTNTTTISGSVGNTSNVATSILERRMAVRPVPPKDDAPPPTTTPPGVGGSKLVGISKSPPRHHIVPSSNEQVDFEIHRGDNATSSTMTPFQDVTNETLKAKENDKVSRKEDGVVVKTPHGNDRLPPPPPPGSAAAAAAVPPVVHNAIDTATDMDANLDKDLPELNTNKRLTLQALQQVATSPKRKDSLSSVVEKDSPKKEDGMVVVQGTSESVVENVILTTDLKSTDEPLVVVNDSSENNHVSSPAKESSASGACTSLPPSSPNETSTLRLVRELRMAKQENKQAMKRMAELEGQVMELRFELNTAVAKSQQTERTGGRTVERNDDSMMGGRSNRNRRMMKSPEPRRDRTEDPLKDLNVASRAVETVEEIFESPLARFVVRKPYGGNEIQEYRFSKDDSTDGKSVLDFSVPWVEAVDDYLKNAHVKDEKTLEVMAKVGADSSILLVYGDSCRHGTPKVGTDGSLIGYEFKTFENVDDMEGTLGKVIFIDSEGNDGEYWLDTIYEEALKIRESYCSNVFSAALALKAAEPFSKETVVEQQQQQKQQRQQQQPPQFPIMAKSQVSPPQVISKPIMVDECVSTEDLLPVSSSTMTSASSASAKKSPSKKPQKEDVRYESHSQQGYGSTAILSHCIVSVFSFIFHIVWFILMIPVRVTQITFTICIMMAIVNVLWLYLADNKIAIDMGAMIDKQYNIN